MSPRYSSAKKPAGQVMKDIRRAMRRHFSVEDKIRIVLNVLRGEDSIAEFAARKGSHRASITPSLIHLVRRVHGSRQAPPGGRYRARRHHQ